MQDAMIDVFSQSNVYEKAVLTASARRPGSVLSGGIIIEVLDSASAIGSFHNRIHLISQDDAIWNNEGWAGIYIEGIHRTSTTIPTDFVDNEIDVELLRTRFVKLNDDGTFNGLQNREARVDPGKTVEEQPTLRRDITIVGADNSGTSLRELPPEVLPGSANDNKVKVKIKEAITSVMPTDYDKKPKPFAIYDNAPDQVEVELELEEINYIGSKNK
jgi:hypothetical protein